MTQIDPPVEFLCASRRPWPDGTLFIHGVSDDLVAIRWRPRRVVCAAVGVPSIVARTDYEVDLAGGSSRLIVRSEQDGFAGWLIVEFTRVGWTYTIVPMLDEEDNEYSLPELSTTWSSQDGAGIGLDVEGSLLMATVEPCSTVIGTSPIFDALHG